MLDELAPRFGLGTLRPAELDELNRVWHRLTPWPDAVAGLDLLRSRYVVATLSNGNVSLLVDMARHAGLRWDCVLSAELAERYKPHPAAYLTAARLLGLEPSAVMMVASHRHDLDAARRVGFRTAFVSRPAEYGPKPADTAVDGEYDVVATDFVDLARRLGVGGGASA
jgi:2-haloacid dehalogenase